MNKKTTLKNASDNKKTMELIKSLGGAKSIHNYLLSKNKNISIESIYKWKTNGIPYRYRSEIKELSNNNSVSIPADTFSDNNSNNTKTEIISSSSDQNNKSSRYKNIYLYFLIIISIVFLLNIFYYNNNITKLENKIFRLEKILTSISSLNYNEEIASLKKINQTNNELINNNSIDINEISLSNNKNSDIINKIEEKISNFTPNQINDLQANPINSNYILLCLMNIKNDIKYASPSLNQIPLINDYFNNIVLPKDVELSTEALQKLKNLNLLGHKLIIQKISKSLTIINEPIKENKNTETTLLDNIKNLIKITRTDDTQSINTNNSIFKIVSALNNHNYKDSLNELELINTNNILNEPIADIKNIQILYESVDVLIKWLIFKG